MKPSKTLLRNSHFLGTKIRNLRKRNHLTMEDLSVRCIKIDPEAAPSVSYLSMIERGKRTPSIEMLDIICQVFQKPLSWFLDDSHEQEDIQPVKGNSGGITGIALEPNFLFSNDVLQIAIPEMLSQTGTTGRQFAHLLIRAHQERHQNHFPDLERAAEEIGQKRMPLSVEDLLDIIKNLGLRVTWFDRQPETITLATANNPHSLIRSFFEPPNRIYINNAMKREPLRLKYDLAVHIGHCILHNNDGLKSVLVAGRTPGINLQQPSQTHGSAPPILDNQDILHAWRDFECSFFAGALLCPKVPFRQLLDRHGYEISSSQIAGVSPTVAMRRMTAVSPYPHWHYFDAYSPGTLKAVYRGNGIPLPWGNMRKVEDPCQHWAVFRMINSTATGSSAQISILNSGDTPKIYCCESLKVTDMAGNDHVLCTGIDLNPALIAQGHDAIALAQELKAFCIGQGGSAFAPKAIKKDILSVAKILNIHWIDRGLENEIRSICARGAVCPREPHCYKEPSTQNEMTAIQQIQQEIISTVG